MIVLRNKNFAENLPAVVQAEEAATKKGGKILSALKNHKKLAIAATAGTAAVGAGAYAAKKIHDKRKEQKEFASTRRMMKAAQRLVDDGVGRGGVITKGTRRAITAATAPGMNKVAFTKEGDKIIRRTAKKTFNAMKKEGYTLDKATREQVLKAGNQEAKNEALAAIKRGGKLPKSKF